MRNLLCLIVVLFFVWRLYHNSKCKHFYMQIKSNIKYDNEGYHDGEYVTYKCDYCHCEITRFEKYGDNK
jgi:hypothetical protein